MSTKQRAISGGALGLVVILVVVILVVTGGSKKPTTGATAPTTTTAGSTPTTTGFAPFPPNICPLTDLPAAGGVAPNRPALLVKVGNEPDGARPQSGLNEADIVFDTPAEGFIMRYIAVYQCNNATAIGPTRSLRWVDYHLGREFVDPIVAFAGGIDPNSNYDVGYVMQTAKWLYPEDLLTNAASAAYRTTSRVPPDNLFTSTKALYGFYSKRVDKPRPVFEYSTAVPPGSTPASSAQIDFSSGTDAVWTWNASGNDWLHSYAGSGPDIDQDTNQQVSTTNIIIQEVHYKTGPYIESTGGSGDIESQTLGTGNAIILRNGTQIKVTWHRKDLIAPTTFTDASGRTVSLAPGRTWVELVPDSVYASAGAVKISS